MVQLVVNMFHLHRNLQRMHTQLHDNVRHAHTHTYTHVHTNMFGHAHMHACIRHM